MSVDGLAVGSAPAARRVLPDAVQDYLALTKPSIVLLLLVTTVPAMVLADGGWPGTSLVVATLLGGILASGGACAVNMYIDRDIDGVMSRTRTRPIPRGTVPPLHALWFGLVLGASSVAWLVATVNPLSAALGAAAFFVYTVVYSLLKRTTVHNTVLGGFAGAAPPLIGWAAVTGHLGVEGLLLFLLVLVWQPAHFWALAIEYVDDYRAAGIPMLPVIAGEAETRRRIAQYATLTVAISLVLWSIAGLGAIYGLAAVGGGAGMLYFAARLRRSSGRGSARPMFHYSTTYLTLLFLAVLADRLLLS